MPQLIFIIDDDLVYLKLMKDHFKQMNDFIVESYTEAEEALLHLKHKDPFLIILDHNLEHKWKDGLYYLKEIKKLNSKVPVIYMTSDSKIDLKERAIGAGAHTFIFKGSASLIYLRKTIEELAEPKKQGFFSRRFK
jgi:DNA-binding NtrC family response regulator